MLTIKILLQILLILFRQISDNSRFVQYKTQLSITPSHPRQAESLFHILQFRKLCHNLKNHSMTMQIGTMCYDFLKIVIKEINSVENLHLLIR